MTTADWAILIPAIAALLLAAAGWLRANAAHERLNTHLDWWHGPGNQRSPKPAPPGPATSPTSAPPGMP